MALELRDNEHMSTPQASPNSRLPVASALDAEASAGRRASVSSVASTFGTGSGLEEEAASGRRFSLGSSFFDSTLEDFQRRQSLASATSRLTANYFSSASSSVPEYVSEGVHHFKSRRCLSVLLSNDYFVAFMAAVVVLDLFFSIVDTDATANGQARTLWLQICLNSFLAIYLLELLATVFVMRWHTFKSSWAIFDCIVCTLSLLTVITGAVAADWQYASSFRMLRLVRCMRMLKLCKHAEYSKELSKILQMVQKSAKTLAVSFTFCFFVLTLWSVAAVDTIHPLIQELSASGVLRDCVDCEDAFSSVLVANLTLFKTIIAGDSWGEIAIPVIKAYPLTAFIFVGSHLTVVYGVLNLIVAVVVDTFAEYRARDETALAEALEDEAQRDVNFFSRIFDQLDVDGSGRLSLDELQEGAANIESFRNRLRIMDIDEADFKQLFTMIDTDESGAVAPSEFTSTLSRWMQDSKTAARFIKYNQIQSMRAQEEMQSAITERLDMIELRLRNAGGNQKGEHEHAKSYENVRGTRRGRVMQRGSTTHMTGTAPEIALNGHDTDKTLSRHEISASENSQKQLSEDHYSRTGASSRGNGSFVTSDKPEELDAHPHLLELLKINGEAIPSTVTSAATADEPATLEYDVAVRV